MVEENLAFGSGTASHGALDRSDAWHKKSRLAAFFDGTEDLIDAGKGAFRDDDGIGVKGADFVSRIDVFLSGDAPFVSDFEGEAEYRRLSHDVSEEIPDVVEVIFTIAFAWIDHARRGEP